MKSISINGKVITGTNDAEMRGRAQAAQAKGGQQGESFHSQYGGYLGGLSDQLFNASYGAADQRITEDEQNEIASANQKQAGTLNSAALASSRRKAGGTTFRRRGSATTANQLVSGLGVKNIKARADQRRYQARINAGNITVGGIGPSITTGLSGGVG